MPIFRFLLVFALVASTAACSRLGAGSSGRSLFGLGGSEINGAQEEPATAAGTAGAGQASINLGAFLSAGAVSQLSVKERTEAASAQFYALQYGRPGAPRVWQGDAGSSGKVTVGPYVQVNALDCRDYTHEVTTPKGSFTQSGTACREPDGTWAVVETS